MHKNGNFIKLADSDEQDDVEPSGFHAELSPFNASKGWFDQFQKRFGLERVSLHEKDASSDIVRAEAYLNNKFRAIIEEGGLGLNNFLIWKRQAYFGNEGFLTRT